MRLFRTTRRFWETVRHLRPVQFYGRLYFRLSRPRVSLQLAPHVCSSSSSQWVRPACRTQSQTGPDRFCFLNETRELSKCGWDDVDIAKLWRYNLHYFDDLNAQGADQRKDWHEKLISRWIDENPPGRGSGWEPYPTSLRIVNWIKWSLGGNALSVEARDSLAIQARWLSKRLEYHLLGNHLFANAKALVFAGLFFDGPEAQGWLDRGAGILAHEIPEQILPDGGHFELSTMYHVLATEDMLDLLNISRCFPFNGSTVWNGLVLRFEPILQTMRHWLATMCHPDGEISFFNDAATGIAPCPNEIEHYSVRLQLSALAMGASEVSTLEDSGYVRVEKGQCVVLLDVARIGPDYLPGHAHADTLSFELSFAGQRVLVNSGTSCYGGGPERLHQRATSAHNTVVVAGENSSEVWSSFRVARRAYPVDFVIEQSPELKISCAHDGYARLKGNPVHRRTWQFTSSGLSITDELTDISLEGEALFHLHPGARGSINADGKGGGIEIDGEAKIYWKVLYGEANLRPSTYHPEFGCSHASQCIATSMHKGRCVIELSW